MRDYTVGGRLDRRWRLSHYGWEIEDDDENEDEGR